MAMERYKEPGILAPDRGRQGFISTTTYNLSVTITDRNLPGTDLAFSLELENVTREEAEAALQRIRQFALDGRIELPRHTADLLGLSSVNQKGAAPVKEVVALVKANDEAAK